MPNALTIAGSDSVGGAGLQADIKAFEAVGVHCCSVVTCVTSQNTRKVSSIFPLPLRTIEDQIDSVLEDVKLDAVKTGMLYSGDIAELVAKKLRRGVGPIVVDPVLAASTGASLHSSGLVEAIITKMIPICALVTPNAPEASKISGIEVKNEKTANEAGFEIMEMGPKAVLIKGGHLKGPDAADYLFSGSKVVKLATPRAVGDTHGTGCALASMIAAHLALDQGIEESVRNSKRMIYKAIMSREIVGKGVPCANPLAVLRIDARKADMLEELELAGGELEKLMDSDLLPEVGSNMGYAVPGALEPEEIAAFDGRIIRTRRGARIVGPARYGASKHVARIIVAASSHDPGIRCALNLKCSESNLEACRKAKLSIASFQRAREPKGVSSMTWGVHNAIRRTGGVPDVIYDEGGVGKEPMIRLLGTNPEDVLSKLKRIKAKR
jgi:hydroxymethylpyrimidine kinase/phosphomethylpyrimidine kinase